MPRNDQALLDAIKAHLPTLQRLLLQVGLNEWALEDGFYRFYHHSFKVYDLQTYTVAIVDALEQVWTGSLNKDFTAIVSAGTGHVFDMSHNQRWLEETRPIVEAFFHAHVFLKLVCAYGETLQSAPDMLPIGWAAVLYLYNER